MRRRRTSPRPNRIRCALLAVKAVSEVQLIVEKAQKDVAASEWGKGPAAARSTIGVLG